MNEKKLSGLILIAVIIAFGAYALAQTAQNIADSNANITNIFQIVVNNTDLGYPNGTHERMPKTTYYTNNSPLAIALVGHIVGSGSPKHLDMNLSVNGTVVQNQDIETNPGQNIHDHASIYFILPKGSYYSVDNSTTVSYLNWYEYPILSGRNGTLSVNQTVVNQNIVGGGVTAVQANSPLTYNNVSGNVTIFDNRTEYPNSTTATIQSNIDTLNNSKWNKTDNLNTVIRGVFSNDTSKGTGWQNVSLGAQVNPGMYKFTSVKWGTQLISVGLDDGVSHADFTTSDSLGQFNKGSTHSIWVQNSATDAKTGFIQSKGSGWFNISWTKYGSQTGTLTIIYEGYDINTCIYCS